MSAQRMYRTHEVTVHPYKASARFGRSIIKLRRARGLCVCACMCLGAFVASVRSASVWLPYVALHYIKQRSGYRLSSRSLRISLSEKAPSSFSANAHVLVSMPPEKVSDFWSFDGTQTILTVLRAAESGDKGPDGMGEQKNDARVGTQSAKDSWGYTIWIALHPAQQGKTRADRRRRTGPKARSRITPHSHSCIAMVWTQWHEGWAPLPPLCTVAEESRACCSQMHGAIHNTSAPADTRPHSRHRRERGRPFPIAHLPVRPPSPQRRCKWTSAPCRSGEGRHCP